MPVKCIPEGGGPRGGGLSGGMVGKAAVDAITIGVGVGFGLKGVVEGGIKPVNPEEFNPTAPFPGNVCSEPGLLPGRPAVDSGLFEPAPFPLQSPTIEDVAHLDKPEPGDVPNVFLAQGIARKIAQGHAYDKHVVGQGEFPEIRSRSEFERLISDVITNPDASKSLSRGRRAYWKDDVVVITNPADPDGGTAFRPFAGKAYYDNLR